LQKENFTDMDEKLFQLINGFAGQWQILDAAAIFFAQYSGYVLLGVLFVIFLINRKRWGWKILGYAFVAVVISRFVVAETIRFFYDRPRPFEVLNIVQLVEHGAGASFPSGHAAFYFALSWFLFFWNKKIGVAFLAVTLFMTIARVFSGIHYPLDILAGCLIGFVSALGAYLIQKAR
jgi:undecaprenyl-diphosphatase